MDVYIPDLFDPQKIIRSGQCFRAACFPDGTCRFITGDQVVYLRKHSEGRYRVSCAPEIWEEIWRPYFDLDRNYLALSGRIPEKDRFLRTAAQVGAGIRILRQDPWEMLMSFLISQRKSIPAIRGVVEHLCRRYGTQIHTPVERIYTFPTPVQLKAVGEQAYIECKAGYRAPYLQDAVRQVLEGRLDLKEAAGLSDDGLIAALEQVKGVGVKVANCVALFAYGRTACAPVDTWIAKIIRQHYRGRSPFRRYGDAAGIMQQYFFYYAQSHKEKGAKLVPDCDCSCTHGEGSVK